MLECLTVSLSIDHRNAEKLAGPSSPSSRPSADHHLFHLHLSIYIYISGAHAHMKSSLLKSELAKVSKIRKALGYHKCSTGISTQQLTGKKVKIAIACPIFKLS